mmetsp:Transcript_14296/g.34528  ORF Transcript_14296/g.34528 Transcript_14296/m.34528 type:complete len:93 (+) Transcript_14296:3091-3369(+)
MASDDQDHHLCHPSFFERDEVSLYKSWLCKSVDSRIICCVARVESNQQLLPTTSSLVRVFLYFFYVAKPPKSINQSINHFVLDGFIQTGYHG